MGSMNELNVVATPQWVESLKGYLQPYANELLNGDWCEGVTNTRLTVEEMRGWILQIYPFIHAFPKFLAEGLIKVEDDYSRNFLIDNIRVEKAHAEHWIWMGQGFGLTRQEMLDAAEGVTPVLRDVQSLTDWLWYINTKGSLAEAVAATSFAIEGLAGDIARKVVNGFEAYRDKPGVQMGPKTYKWFREHAHYDDDHPKIALEIVTRYATTERMQTKVMLAAKRSIQLLHNALTTGYQAYSVSTEKVVPKSEQRANDRRRGQQPLAFPERRFADRRGRQVRAVA
ncbi:MAG TPA: iron-containing redox enzyme family protein [Burkholderiales bacterium]|jgi:pyrroloquinoline quinone (PQQ) biosynthesis protein C|nr:iron-containing redox enzyme family protein [Burkholderiales bacterium]